MEKCDTCENNGKGADCCKITANGKCNYMPTIHPVSNLKRCDKCLYAVKQADGNIVHVHCSIGKSFLDCNSFYEYEPLIEISNTKDEAKRMTHKIKIRESFAEAVYAGSKTFEVRKNDRGYQNGDLVKFTVLYDSDGLEMINHPLHDMTFEITYVLAGWGIEDGYVVFGIKPVK